MVTTDPEESSHLLTEIHSPLYKDDVGVYQMLPPVVQEDGSTASTETLCPRAVSIFPTTSMKEDFPAPGGPDRPERSTKHPNQLY